MADLPQRPKKATKRKSEADIENSEEEQKQQEEESSEDAPLFQAAFAGYDLGMSDKRRFLKRLFSVELIRRRRVVRKNWEYISEGITKGLLDKAGVRSLQEEDQPILIKLITDHVSAHKKAIQEAIVSNENFDPEKVDESIDKAVDLVVGELSKGSLLDRYKEVYNEVLEDQASPIDFIAFFNTGVENKQKKGIEKEVFRRIKMDDMNILEVGISHGLGLVDSIFLTPLHRLNRVRKSVQKATIMDHRKQVPLGQFNPPIPMTLKDGFIDADFSDFFKALKIAAIGVTLTWLASQIASSLGVEGVARLLMVSCALGAAAAVAGAAGFGAWWFLTWWGLAPEIAAAGGIITALLVAIGIYVAYRRYKARAKKREKEVPYIVSNWVTGMQEKSRLHKAADGIKSHRGKLSAAAIVAIIASQYLISDFLAKKKVEEKMKQQLGDMEMQQLGDMEMQPLAAYDEELQMQVDSLHLYPVQQGGELEVAL